MVLLPREDSDMHSVRLRGREEPIAVGKIVCVGANYGRHVDEMGRRLEEPMLFLKPPTSLARDGDSIPYPAFSTELHHELEMVLLIGEAGSSIAPERARGHIAGIAAGLDLTARDRQRRDMERGFPWAVSKGFDGSAPVSEFVLLTGDLDPDDVRMALSVNGEARQRGSTANMLLPCDRLVALASRYFTLLPGDLIFTGTPEGVGPLQPGDELEIELESLVSARFFIAPAAAR